MGRINSKQNKSWPFFSIRLYFTNKLHSELQTVSNFCWACRLPTVEIHVHKKKNEMKVSWILRFISEGQWRARGHLTKIRVCASFSQLCVCFFSGLVIFLHFTISRITLLIFLGHCTNNLAITAPQFGPVHSKIYCRVSF